MKRLVVLALSGVLVSFCLTAVSAEPSKADQKWFEAVQKMVASGEHKLSTPNETRANLLKDWGKEKGYTVKVTKTDTGYSIEVSGNEAAKTVAQR